MSKHHKTQENCTKTTDNMRTQQQPTWESIWDTSHNTGACWTPVSAEMFVVTAYRKPVSFYIGKRHGAHGIHGPMGPIPRILIPLNPYLFGSKISVALWGSYGPHRGPMAAAVSQNGRGCRRGLFIVKINTWLS